MRRWNILESLLEKQDSAEAGAGPCTDGQVQTLAPTSVMPVAGPPCCSVCTGKKE